MRLQEFITHHKSNATAVANTNTKHSRHHHNHHCGQTPLDRRNCGMQHDQRALATPQI